MKTQAILIKGSVLLTFGMFAVYAFYPRGMMWGIDHLAYLPQGFTWVFGAATLLTIGFLFFPVERTRPDRVVGWIDHFVYGGRTWPALAIAAAITLLFYLGRSTTHFLGDGYTLLGVFGQGESYINRWAEPGSIFLIRQLQSLFGGYTRQTTLWACQLLSIASGFVVILNLISIAGKISQDAACRLLVLISLVSSGVILLFFGYVEYYPVMWASGATFVNLSFEFLLHNRRFWLALMAFGVTTLMHFMAIIFVGGVLFLIGWRFSGRVKSLRSGFTLFTVAGSVTGAVLFLFVWLFMGETNLAAVFLPIVPDPGVVSSYTLFSTKHIADLMNMVMVVFPGSLVLAVIFLCSKAQLRKDPVTVFLTLLSIGSLLFLTLIDPKLGMARDWDMMSLTLLPPGLLVLRFISSGSPPLTGRITIAYTVLCVLCTTAYVEANVTSPASEQRFDSLLSYYGSKDDTGWAIHAYYYLNKGEYKRAMELARGMEANRVRLDMAYHLLGVLHAKTGKLGEAEYYYEKALQLRSYNPRIRNEFGQLLMKMGKNELALEQLRKARTIDPTLTFVAEGIGLAYYHLGHLDSALAIADSLFVGDSHSPGGYLLKMIVAVRKGDQTTAAYCFRQFLKYGRHRSDYGDLSEYYRYLSADL